MSSRLNPVASQEAPGLQTLLKTSDFGEWDHAVSNSLGHHRSRLLPQSPPFAAQLRSGAVEEFKVLLLQGSGQVELLREQTGHGVLWLPLQGWTVETVNGQELLAEPGMGLLFRPGDVMRGWTSASITGISILLPESALAGASQHVPLLHQGIAARRLINAGQQLANAAAQPTPGSRFAAEALSDALQQWADTTKPDGRRERITAQRRRTTVARSLPVDGATPGRALQPAGAQCRPGNACAHPANHLPAGAGMHTDGTGQAPEIAAPAPAAAGSRPSHQQH